ncbi:CLUMA_CG018659, isoform A [Clunio marinus]|uniref:CLUMA_CG018659, isoform A n=1 Tax=Clunio marinus TaxID=568069 RepID=A0A1J1IZM7_9DIPT|nr:CLUMA_CG018659, isoform A [Clunio marinus]
MPTTNFKVPDYEMTRVPEYDRPISSGITPYQLAKAKHQQRVQRPLTAPNIMDFSFLQPTKSSTESSTDSNTDRGKYEEPEFLISISNMFKHEDLARKIGYLPRAVSPLPSPPRKGVQPDANLIRGEIYKALKYNADAINFFARLFTDISQYVERFLDDFGLNVRYLLKIVKKNAIQLIQLKEKFENFVNVIENQNDNRELRQETFLAVQNHYIDCKYDMLDDRKYFEKEMKNIISKKKVPTYRRLGNLDEKDYNKMLEIAQNIIDRIEVFMKCVTYVFKLSKNMIKVVSSSTEESEVDDSYEFFEYKMSDDNDSTFNPVGEKREITEIEIPNIRQHNAENYNKLIEGVDLTKACNFKVEIRKVMNFLDKTIKTAKDFLLLNSIYEEFKAKVEHDTKILNDLKEGLQKVLHNMEMNTFDDAEDEMKKISLLAPQLFEGRDFGSDKLEHVRQQFVGDYKKNYMKDCVEIMNKTYACSLHAMILMKKLQVYIDHKKDFFNYKIDIGVPKKLFLLGYNIMSRLRSTGMFKQIGKAFVKNVDGKKFRIVPRRATLNEQIRGFLEDQEGVLHEVDLTLRELTLRSLTQGERTVHIKTKGVNVTIPIFEVDVPNEELDSTVYIDSINLDKFEIYGDEDMSLSEQAKKKWFNRPLHEGPHPYSFGVAGNQKQISAARRHTLGSSIKVSEKELTYDVFSRAAAEIGKKLKEIENRNRSFIESDEDMNLLDLNNIPRDFSVLKLLKPGETPPSKKPSMKTIQRPLSARKKVKIQIPTKAHQQTTQMRFGAVRKVPKSTEYQMPTTNFIVPDYEMTRVPEYDRPISSGITPYQLAKAKHQQRVQRPLTAPNIVYIVPPESVQKPQIVPEFHMANTTLQHGVQRPLGTIRKIPPQTLNTSLGRIGTARNGPKVTYTPSVLTTNHRSDPDNLNWSWKNRNVKLRNKILNRTAAYNQNVSLQRPREIGVLDPYSLMELALPLEFEYYRKKQFDPSSRLPQWISTGIPPPAPWRTTGRERFENKIDRLFNLKHYLLTRGIQSFDEAARLIAEETGQQSIRVPSFPKQIGVPLGWENERRLFERHENDFERRKRMVKIMRKQLQRFKEGRT